ncbi:MAG: hypothetical protein Q7R96_02120 [Nanoarchaeota archaeon]|nr:hypothetical protein [Nanoarchaeota archaeon]
MTGQFTFGGASQLAGRTLQQPLARYAYVPKSEEGLQEHIFCYQQQIPGPTEEPQLYQGATVEEHSTEERTLRFTGIDEIIMLLTVAADDQFRTENPELVKKNELFRIDY